MRYYILMIPIKDQAFGPFWAHSEACEGNLPEAWSAVRAREHLCKNGEGEHCTVSTKECPIEDIGWLHIHIYIIHNHMYIYIFIYIIYTCMYVNIYHER